MPTNEERHEVAARLRSLNDNIYHVRKVYDAAGITILCNDQADYYQICNAVCGYLPAEVMHPCDYKEFHNRLADLIEPEPERTCRSIGMRPTDTERRLLAKRMREAVPASFGIGSYSVDMGDSEHPLYIVGESEHALRGALGYLAKLIEPEPERTGHLVEREDGSHACSECGASYLCMTDASYCPDCGVRLED